MHNLINDITQASSLIQAILFVVIFSVLWNIENVMGLTRNYQKWRHAWRNSVFIPTNFPVTFLLGLAFTAVTHWTAAQHFGLLYWFPGLSKLAAVFVVSIVLLDLVEYVYHRLMHRYKLLWRLHLVHHSDPVVDVSTVLREHPGETSIRLLNTLFWAFLFGVPVWCLVFRQILQVVVTTSIHSNLRLPERVDRALGWVFITPNLHHVHHHFKQPYTDRNFGDILSIWDRLFGTFVRLDAREVVFGVDTCPLDVEHANGLALLQLPFQAPKAITPVDSL